MADDLAGNLQSYKLQLQQVEAALATDAGNEDLLKLQKDLTEVIELTKELVRNQTGSSDGSKSAPVSTSSAASSTERTWKAGDKCMAIFSASGKYADATIDCIMESGQCTVSFDYHNKTETTMISLLKPSTNKKRQMIVASDDIRSKKQILLEQKEYKKKKANKKAARMKELEEEREVEKGKWQNFNTKKAFSKNKKGHVKRSIFASPDNVNGRVGVGTCGIGGKPMTDYHHQEKYKK